MKPPLLLLLLATLCSAADYKAVQVARWQSAKVQPYRQHETKVIADRIAKNWVRYHNVSARTNVPIAVIAGLHNMESGGSFACHLHEGSPLTARTRYVPKGRPVTGTPPFTWEFSAEDALLFDHMDSKNWYSLGDSLTAVEFYNGSGYLKYHPSTPTPYLWAATTVERPGKYVADGRWSPTARSNQIGVAAIWKELEARGLFIPPDL